MISQFQDDMGMLMNMYMLSVVRPIKTVVSV